MLFRSGSEIDVLVNLNGYFGIDRTDVFAMRPSPVQVNYLGYPGTMGAGYMDYIIADRTIIPENQQRYYSEQVVYLPDTYQPNDRKRQPSEMEFTRADLGLPENAVVFCCFNNAHKITPEMFDIWMRILRGTPESVLWLIEPNSSVRGNLTKEAARKGVSSNRLVFAPMIKQADHLGRLAFADLVLDTLPHNAHTTASDALWSGVPVLTCLGNTFPGRVAASLLKAIGLSELITGSLTNYEETALRLARDKALLAELKAKVIRNRATAPLFDTPLYAKNIEAAYKTMFQRSQAGLKPKGFSIGPK